MSLLIAYVTHEAQLWKGYELMCLERVVVLFMDGDAALSLEIGVKGDLSAEGNLQETRLLCM